MGDFILWLKSVLKQHFFCIHNYKPHVLGMGEHMYEECTKCGKIK